MKKKVIENQLKDDIHKIEILQDYIKVGFLFFLFPYIKCPFTEICIFIDNMYIVNSLI
jgi:hypothetical protein